MSGPAEGRADAPLRVTTLELFFDLVFVFTVTQLTATLANDPGIDALVRVALMLGVIWWMYGGYAWLTNAVRLDGPGRRALLLGGMAAYLVLALTIPRAFDDPGDGEAFGLAYLAIVLIHAGLFTRATGRGATGILRLAPYNLASAGLVLAGGLLGGTAQYGLWLAAVLLEWVTPFLVPPTAHFEIAPAHFVERHGLVVIIAIGESVVAIGIAAEGLAFDVGLVVGVVLGLALSACLWWAYFGGGDDERAEAALAGSDRAPMLGLLAYGLAHLPLLLGIVGVALGLKKGLEHPYDAASAAAALGVGAGAATFFVGDVLFRGVLGLGSARWRLASAALALASIPLGLVAGPAAQVAALVAVVVAALLTERRAAPLAA